MNLGTGFWIGVWCILALAAVILVPLWLWQMGAR